MRVAYILLMLIILFFSCREKRIDNLFIDSNMNKVNLISPDDTSLNHTLSFRGEFFNSRVLILDNKKLVADKMLLKESIEQNLLLYSTNSSSIGVIILDNKKAFDSIVPLDSFGKYIIVAKLNDTSFVISGTNDFSRFTTY